MKNKGIVKTIEKNSIFVEIYRDSACASCSSCSNKTCGIREFKYNKGDLNIGDTVVLSSSDKFILKLSFLIYIIPIITMFLGYYIAAELFHLGEAHSILISFIFLFISMFFIFLVDKYKGSAFEENITIKKESN